MTIHTVGGGIDPVEVTVNLCIHASLKIIQSNSQEFCIQRSEAISD